MTNCVACSSANVIARYPPGDTALTVDPLEEANQHELNVHPRSQGGSPQALGVKAFALAFAELIEPRLFQHLGTSAQVAEQLGRRWIACDLGRYAVQVTRKRLLDLEGCRPFEVLNLGKYERQYC